MQFSRKTTPMLGLATLATLGLAAQSVQAQAPTFTTTALIVNGVTQASTSSAIVTYGQTVEFDYTYTDPNSSFNPAFGAGGLKSVTDGTSIAAGNVYNSGGTPNGKTGSGFSSFTVGSGISTGLYSGPSYAIFDPNGLHLYNGPTANLTVVTPEPSSVAAFAFTGLGAFGLILKARKRKASAV